MMMMLIVIVGESALASIVEYSESSFISCGMIPFN
jgi:hypothetical protein